MKARSFRPAAVVLAVLLVLLALYAAAGFWLVPRLAHRYIPVLEERLGQAVDVGEIRFNPFLLTAQATGVVVEGPPGKPMLVVGRLFLDAAWRGLVSRTWVLDEVAAEGLKANIVVREDGTSNVGEVVDRFSSAGTPDSEPPAVVVGKLVVPDAQVDIAVPGEGDAAAGVTMHPVNLRASNISTIPSDGASSYELDAAFADGAKLQTQGEITLEPAFAVSGRLDLRQLPLGTVRPFLRETLLASELAGVVDLSGAYAHGPQQPLRLSDVNVTATDVSVAGKGEGGGGSEPLLRARQLAARGASVDVGARAARVGEMSLTDAKVRVEAMPGGALNWASLLAPAGDEKQEPADSSSGWTLDLARLRLEQVALAYTDRAGAPLSFEADGLSAGLRISLATGGAQTQFSINDASAQWKAATLRMPGSVVPLVELGQLELDEASFDLAQRTIAAKTLALAGGRVSVTAEPEQAKRGQTEPAGDPWKLRISTLQFASLGARYAKDAGSTEPLAQVGSIDGRLTLEMSLGGATTQLVASAVDAAARDAVLSGAVPGLEMLRLDAVEVSNGRLDLAGRQVGAQKLVARGRAAVVRDPAQPAKTTSEAGKGEGSEGGDWKYAFEALEVPSLELQLTDRGEEPAMQLAGTLQARASNVESGSRLSFDGKLALAAGGVISANGTAVIEPVQVRAQANASDVALVPFEPLLQRFAAVELSAGAASGVADVAYESGSEASVRLEGQLGISNLALTEAASGDPFMSWKQLEARGASISLGPQGRQVTVREVAVLAPQAKIVISQERDLNLLQVLKPDDDDPSAEASTPAERGRGTTFEVERLVLQDGEVDFTDLSLVLPFSTTVKALDGTLVGISSDPERRAVVQASGTIEPYGSASIEGSLIPVEPTRFTNLEVEFNNVPVPPLSPYTATFAGRKVQSGRLWLGLQYRIEEGELLGKNEIRLQDFRLGERVQAPDALDVPLDLVVALLSDSSGEIRLSVPVTGEVGSASFSVAAAVRQAIGNVLKRTVSAPFRAIAGLFGGTSESLAAIGFKPGSAQLEPEQIEKLDTLSRALSERPQLGLLVDAPYDPQLDERAMQQDQARRALAQALGRNLGPQQDPGPVSLDDPAVQRALEGLLRSAAGEGAVQALQQEIGGGRKLYEAMLDRVATAQALPASATQVLAADRARSIAGYLQQHGVAPSRVTTGRLTSVRSDNGEVSARLQVAASAGG